MQKAFFAVFAYCLPTTPLPRINIFNLGIILSWISERIRKLGIVDLQLNYIYGFFDFNQRKRYLSPTPS